MKLEYSLIIDWMQSPITELMIYQLKFEGLPTDCAFAFAA